MKFLFSRLNPNLSTSQRLHLQIPSHWELGLQHINLRRVKKEIKPVNIKGNQHWILTGKTYVEAETLVLCSPDMRSWLIGKDSDPGKDGGLEEKEVTEDEMVGWNHQFNGHELEQTPGDSEGQGSLVCWSLWGCKESDTTEWLINNNNTPFSSYSSHKLGHQIPRVLLDSRSPIMWTHSVGAVTKPFLIHVSPEIYAAQNHMRLENRLKGRS